MMKHLFKIFMSAILLVFVTNINAQVTSSGIAGTVVDELTKEPLIGVSVVVTHVPTGAVYGASTNTKGYYSVQGLRPGGPYKVKASYIGFQTKTFQDLNIGLGETYGLDIWIKEESQTLEQVVVTADRNSRFNSQRTGAASSFNRNSIDRTPSVSRSIFDIAKLTPQANTSGNGTSFAGANNRYNSFQIDGTVNNDVFGLSPSGTNGGQTGANPISLEAIEAVQVVIAPFDVRQSGFTGGGINAITKSGTNNVSASLYGFYNDENFFGTTPGKDVKDRKKLSSQYDYTAGATVGGPIVKDKLFFFLNGEYSDQTYPSNYYIGNGSHIQESEAMKVINKLSELTNSTFNGGGFGETNIPKRNYKGLARIDWNIASGHRLSMRYSYLDASKYIYSNSPDRLTLTDGGYFIKSKTHSAVAELNSRFNNTVSNELRFGYTRVRDHREVRGSHFPSVTVELDNSRKIQFGTERYSQANRLDQDVFTLSDNLSITLGSHVLTIGTHNEFLKTANLFIPDNFGTYIYGMKEFESLGTNNEMLPKEYRYQYSIVPGDSRYEAKFKAAQLGFYVQDDWQATKELKLTYGVRMDMPLFFDTPTENTFLNESQLAKDLGIKNNAMPKMTPLFSPRIGFRWDIANEHLAILRGGAGIFTGRIPFVWISNSFAKTGIEFADTRYRKAKEFPADFKFNSDINNPYTPQNVKVPRAEVDMVTTNFKFPQTARFNLALDFSLPWGIKGTLEGLFNKNINDVNYKNVLNTRDGEDMFGRPLYKSVGGEYAKRFSSLILLGNTDKGYSYTLTSSLSKSFDFGLNATVAYTYGHSYGSNDGTSSQAFSNWQYNQTFYGDDVDELAYTNFDLGHRVVATLNYRKEYLGHFATSIGLIYNGQTGRRFSMVINGDLNGDGARSNDLAYIPTESDLTAMNMKAADKDAFASFINNNEEIAKYRGTYVPRNALITPFVNQFDLHFAQEFFFNIAGRRHTFELNADVLNIGNMIDRSWGNTYSVNYGAISPLGIDKGEYNFHPLKGGMWYLNDIDSRWRAQVGLKYKF